MSSEKPSFEKRENPDKQMRQKLESEGWQYVALEQTHATPFDAKTGRFEPKELKSEEQIKKEYLDKYGKNGFTEIKLVRPHIDKGEIVGFIEDKHTFIVYMRRPQNAE